ncbi:MAG: HDIG domain-containing protein [Bacteroidales bacterium]|jgi:hypothetical protein|nr:HDIG domain-containing protein [Bacteroidales bacterium]
MFDKDKFRKIWSRFYKPVYRITAFVVAGLFMVLSFPKVDKYNYEYELQRPWRHETVIAPFDIPIFKTDEEIALEEDSVRAFFRPYYHRDSINEDDIRAKVAQTAEIYAGKFEIISPINIETDTVRNFTIERLTQHLISVYNVGIIDIPDNVDDEQLSTYELMIISGNILEPFSFDELYTRPMACTAVTTRLINDLNNRFGRNQWTQTLVDRLPINELITSNIKYDTEKSQSELNARMSSIPLSNGKVLAGQKIIDTGEIVDKRTARILDSLSRIYETQYAASDTWAINIGELLIVYSLLSCVFFFLFFFRRKLFKHLRFINFILLIMLIFVVGAGFMAHKHLNISFIIPFTCIPIIIRIFIDSRLAMYVHTITILIISFFAYNSQLFLLLHIPAGILAIITLINVTRRVQLVRTSLVVLGSYLLCYLGYNLWHTGELNVHNINIILMFVINAALILMVYPMIYIFERLFKFVSDVTLMELSDTNHPLLRELAEKAPGTFQHSIQVGNLAQAVAYKIGANAMLVRAGAMYHDIGKMVAPLYFTENQVNKINPHVGMDFVKSAAIVISHVTNGVKIAQQHNLPTQIIDIILSHHGTTKARYFYISWRNAHNGQEPDPRLFTYTGHTPTTKEEAIVMMADAVEASSKSLTEYTDESIDALVDKIIDGQIEQKQYNDAPITFKDISKAKSVMKEKLKSVYHTRIRYPELSK